MGKYTHPRDEMSNFNFEDVLSKHNHNPLSIMKKYRYDSGKEVFSRINGLAEETDDILELSDIVNQIVLWKINRVVRLSDSNLLALNHLKSIKNIEDALSEKQEEIKLLLSSLLSTKGVRLPMASSFLHFFNPSVFPIIDQRAYRVIYKHDYKASTNIDVNVALYLDYMQRCRTYHSQHLAGVIDFCDIDKYLYQLDIEAGNTVKT